MELIHKRHNTSKLAREDFISYMPDIVITDIMDRLPIQDAVKTSVLSRNWRFKWTLLSQLVFDRKFYEYLKETKGEDDYGRIVSRILIDVRGSVTKFVLYIDNPVLDAYVYHHSFSLFPRKRDKDHTVLDADDINHWILLLSIKGVKDLTLNNKNERPETPLKLTTHLFSCLELKHLNLFDCCIHPPPTFHGFPNLLSLELRYVELESGKFGDLIAQCPALEILNLGRLISIGKIKLVEEIAKLENLKILSFSLCDLDPMMMISSSTIFELVGSLPKLQELRMDFVMCKVIDGGAKKRLPAVFPGLKALKLSQIDLDDENSVSCFFDIIRSFQNLETLEITACEAIDTHVMTPTLCSLFCSVETYNTMGLLHLRSVVFKYVEGSVNDEYLVKYLLACSPSLKRIVIHPQFPVVVYGKKVMLAEKLLKFHRASPVVDFDIY